MSGQRFTADDVARLLVKHVKGAKPTEPFGLAAKPRSAEMESAVLLIQPETESQQALIKWWGYYAPTKGLDTRLLMAFPLQGKRNAANGARMKAEGLRAGTPDLFLAIPKAGSAGLWIEMKTYRKGSVLSASQREMLAELANVGYTTVVPRSAREAEAAIVSYLGP